MVSDRDLAAFRRHWAAGDHAAAERTCRTILGARPTHADTLHLLALAVASWGNMALAIECLEQAVALPQTAASLHADLARLYHQHDRLAQAQAAAERALALDPACAAAWHDLGVVQRKLGHLEESRQSLERARALFPQAPNIRVNLGNTLVALGALEAATAEYEAALAVAPDAMEVHGSLATALLLQGRFEEARGHAAHAIAIAPQRADLYVNAAMIEARVGDFETARGLIEAGLRAEPEHLTSGLVLATLLGQLGYAQESIATARRAVAMAPAQARTHEVLGSALQRAHADDEALQAYQRAAELAEQPGSPLLKRALLLMELGAGEEGEATMRQAVGAEPYFAPAWYGLADIGRISPAEIGGLEAWLAGGGPPLTADTRMVVEFAIGRGLLAQGEAERGLAHLHAGNAIMRASLLRYEVAADERQLAEIAAHTPRSAFSEVGPDATPSDVPVFVVGMPRSGTTLVEQILAAHPRAHGAGELQLFPRLLKRFPAIDRVDELSPAQRREFGQAYVSELTALAPGAARIVDKLPSNFMHAGAIHASMPNARVIHCRRDALDTCLSCYAILFDEGQEFTYELGELGRYYRAYDALMQHWRSVLPAHALLEIDYEDVVADLEGAARRLIAFCGLPWDDACLQFHRVQRPVRSASRNQVRVPIYTSSLGRGRALREALGPLVDALGSLAR